MHRDNDFYIHTLILTIPMFNIPAWYDYMYTLYTYASNSAPERRIIKGQGPLNDLRTKYYILFDVAKSSELLSYQVEGAVTLM